MPGLQRSVSDRLAEAFVKLCGRTQNLSRQITAAAQEDEHWLHTSTQACKIQLREKQAEPSPATELLADSTLESCGEGAEAESAVAYQPVQTEVHKLGRQTAAPAGSPLGDSDSCSSALCHPAEQCTVSTASVACQHSANSQPADPQPPCTPDPLAICCSSRLASLHTDLQATGLNSLPQQLLQAHVLPLLSLHDLAVLACSSSFLRSLVLSADADIWVQAARAAQEVPQYPKMPASVPGILSILQKHRQAQQSLQRGEPSQIQHLSPKARNDWSLAPDGSYCSAVAADRQHILLKSLPAMEAFTCDMDLAIVSMHWHAASASPTLVMLMGDEPCTRHVCMFDVLQGMVTHDFALPWSKGSCFSWSPGAQFLLLVQKQQTCLIRVASGQEYKLSGPPPHACVWSPDAFQIAIKVDTGRDRRIIIWDVTEIPVVVGSIAQAAEQVIAPLAWAGQRCKSLLVKKTDRGSINVRLVLCEITDSGVQTRGLAALSSQVSHVEVSHNGARAAALIRVGRRFQALVWDVEQCRQMQTWLMDAQHVSSMAFSPCDRFLAVAFARVSRDFSIAVHDLANKAGLAFVKVQQPLPDCSRPVLPSPSHVCWTHDQRSLLCTIRDGTGWHHGVLVSFSS